jgi:hypothetical protein
MPGPRRWRARVHLALVFASAAFAPGPGGWFSPPGTRGQPHGLRPASEVTGLARAIAGISADSSSRDPQPLQHPPHRTGAHPDAQAGQLALDPLVPPARVLPRRLLDQHREPCVDRWPAAPAGIGPPPPDQTPVPAQQRARGHQPAQPQRSGQQPGQRGDHRTVGPVRPRPGGSAAAAPPPPGAVPAARHPSTPPNVPAAPSSQSGARRAGKASVPSRPCDLASPGPPRAAYSQASHLRPVLEPHRVRDVDRGV